MTRVDERVLEEIRDQVDIVDLIGERTTLRKAGREFMGLCCFHVERTPSLSVNAEKSLYLCRSCGSGGDAFDFVRQIEGLDFPGAVERLADRLGIAHDAQGRFVALPPKHREVSVERLLKTRVPDDTWLAFYELGGGYTEARAMLQSPLGNARSWITTRARDAKITGDLVTLDAMRAALELDWPAGRSIVWLLIAIEAAVRDAWWRGDTEPLARACDALTALDRPVAA